LKEIANDEVNTITKEKQKLLTLSFLVSYLLLNLKQKTGNFK
jgi:hypothetical protein